MSDAVIANNNSLNARVNFRIPQAVLDEWNAQRKLSGFRTLSDFLRYAVDQQKSLIKNRTARKNIRQSKHPEIARHLIAIGNNVNQIAKEMNINRKAGKSHDLVRFAIALYSVDEQLANLLTIMERLDAY